MNNCVSIQSETSSKAPGKPSKRTWTALKILSDIYQFLPINFKNLICNLLPGSAGGVRGIGGSVQQSGPSWLAWMWSQSEASLPPWQESGSVGHVTLLSRQVVMVSPAPQHVWRKDNSSGSTNVFQPFTYNLVIVQGGLLSTCDWMEIKIVPPN